MLPLDLPGILVTNTEPDGRLFAIHAGCDGRPAACATCGSQNFIGHGQHAQEVMDLPHQGKLTCIHLLRKRYRCKDCSDTFFHPLDWLDDDHHASNPDGHPNSPTFGHFKIPHPDERVTVQ